MKVWSSIFNFFAVVILAFLIIIFHQVGRTNEKQFEELRLRHAVDYATEAAFRMTLETDDIGIAYEDLQTVKLNPKNVFTTFKSILCLTYDMSMSKDNMDALNEYIPFAVLASADGYYMASLQEVDTLDDGISGGQYALKWGMKKPYAMKFGEKYVALNMYDESWMLAKSDSSGKTIVTKGQKWGGAGGLSEKGVFVDRDKILKFINERITDDINYTVKQRNKIYSKHTGNNFVYLPTNLTASGVNTITKPTLFIMLQGVDFAGSQMLEAKSVGGFSTTKKRRPLGFVEDGIKYYCFETQLPKDKLGSIETFFDTVDEAAKAGYRPHTDYIRREIK